MSAGCTKQQEIHFCQPKNVLYINIEKADSRTNIDIQFGNIATSYRIKWQQSGSSNIYNSWSYFFFASKTLLALANTIYKKKYMSSCGDINKLKQQQKIIQLYPNWTTFYEIIFTHSNDIGQVFVNKKYWSAQLTWMWQMSVFAGWNTIKKYWLK